MGISYPIEFTVDQNRLECIEESPEGQFHRHHDAEKRPKFPYTLQQEGILLCEIMLLTPVHSIEIRPVDLLFKMMEMPKCLKIGYAN